MARSREFIDLIDLRCSNSPSTLFQTRRSSGSAAPLNLRSTTNMARTVPSAVLSPADKKAQVTTLKVDIKAAKDNAKQLAGIRKEADKVFATAGKAHIAAMKENDKAVAASEKALGILTAKLDVLVPAKVSAEA